MPIQLLDPQPAIPDGLGLGAERVVLASPQGTPAAQGETVAISISRQWAGNNAGAVITARARLLDPATFEQETTADGRPIVTEYPATIALQKIRRADVGLKMISREVARVVLGQPARPDPADASIDLLPVSDDVRTTQSILEAAALARGVDGTAGDVDDVLSA